MRKVAVCGLVGVQLALLGCGGARPPEPVAAAPAAAPQAKVVGCERVHPGVGAQRADVTRQSNAVALARLGDATYAYVADEDSQVVHTIDVARGAEVATTRVEGAPAQLMMLADGRVAVTLRDKNRVEVLEPAAQPSSPLEPRCTVAVPTEPFGMAETPDDKHVLVTSAWGEKVTVLDEGSMRPSFDVKVAREPRAIVVDDSGEHAFVAHVVGAKMSVIDLTTDKHEVREIDLRVKKLISGGNARFGANGDRIRGGCQGFALAKAISDDGAKNNPPVLLGEKPLVLTPPPKAPAPNKPVGRIFAPMVTVDPGDPNVRSPAYYGESFDGVAKEAPIVSVIDADAERPLTKTVMSLGAKLAQECILPRSATYRPSTGTLFVTCFGIDSVIELDTRGLDPARLERRRWAVPSGPAGLAIDDRKGQAVVWSQFDGRATIIDLSAPADQPSAKAANLSYTPTADALELAAGRKLYHLTDDRRISSDGSACASCHPDGREDALTWSTPDGPRQTIMLAGRAGGTAPYGWLGKHANLHDYVTNTFIRLGGTGLQGSELASVVKYVEGMRGPSLDATRDLDHGSDEALVARGKDLFFEAQQGCVTCHLGGAGVDETKHDVGSKATADVAKEFDTPSLRFISGTAPYFHDGRYATLEALLGASDNQMGHTLQLSKRDQAAMKAYLERL